MFYNLGAWLLYFNCILEAIVGWSTVYDCVLFQSLTFRIDRDTLAFRMLYHVKIALLYKRNGI